MIEPSPESSNQSPRQVAVVGADEDYSYEFSADSSMFNDSYQCIRFQAFQQNTWHLLFDRNLKELYVIGGFLNQFWSICCLYIDFIIFQFTAELSRRCGQGLQFLQHWRCLRLSEKEPFSGTVFVYFLLWFTSICKNIFLLRLLALDNVPCAAEWRTLFR